MFFNIFIFYFIFSYLFLFMYLLSEYSVFLNSTYYNFFLKNKGLPQNNRFLQDNVQI